MMTVKLQHPDRLLIGGEWVAPVDGAPIAVVSPDSEEVVMEVAGAGPGDMDRAVAAARRAFDDGGWADLPPEQRIDAVERLAAALDRRADELGAAWSLQMGALAVLAPIFAGIGTQNLRDAVKAGRGFAFEARVESPVASDARIVHEPVGVVAAITPWNVPYMLMTAKVGPALVAGCTIVMKPSPETPLEAYIIAECAEEAGLPPGVINLVPSQREAADHLMRNPGIDKVAFTGSTAVGRQIAQVCAEQVRRCTLELGGKSAAIVLDDMSDEEVAAILTGAITTLSGQVCAMLSRALVPSHRHDGIARAIAAAMEAIRIGHSDDPETQMGPLATRRQLERVEHYVEIGVKEGATIVTGGKKPPQLNRGVFFEPTLFTGVTNDMTIAREEIFGPVLCLIPYDTVEDAIRIANDSIYGLNASVLTHDAAAALAIGRRIRSGTFAQNGLRSDFSLPMGGFKQSGIGREGGEQGLRGYLETKTMLLDTVT
ncbi:acyl-CoA reductase-like NAD-dependent aldehyde dehydrogenase [Novosphingobium chloroacetimidivorans]|uniref:Acyl-CoA reductase-like NAD-dependent aldehyde dehydrogenase n=1 Tax=Novosphingobium chloroacetimidivorans TaxID=1428314 RepID=A0A7W7K9D4_9SPHN|nr:aldehyde dehydrogenase [Novosphingobium chloroacetimidivorans]MBB4858626.1 acyl-CoA reductase-like NAD-dependent aldehyde dehydrogenase [Novosphingobium chloroacetimidivorans]